MGVAIVCRFLLQAVQIHPLLFGKARRHPDLHRYPGLIVRGKLVGRAMQIEPHRPQRLAVIREVDQRRVVLIFILFQLGNHLCNDKIGVADGVVIGVDQLFIAAVLDVAARAVRYELAMVIRIALVVGRTVAADKMEANQLVALHLRHLVVEILQYDLVIAGVLVAELRVIFWFDLDVGHPIAHPFATAVVLLPEDGDPASLQYIEQAFAVAGPVVIKLLAPHVGEHAGHRHRCGRAARAHVLEGDHAPGLTGKGVGLFLVAVHREVLAAGCLPHHQEHQGRFILFRDSLGIITQGGERNGFGDVTLVEILGGAVDIVGRHDLAIEILVVAPDRDVILIVKRRYDAHDSQGCSHGEGALEQPQIPLFRVLDFDKKEQHGGQYTGQRHPDHDGQADIGVGLALVGLEDVLDHILIEHDPILQHGVTDDGASHKEKRKEGFQQVALREGHEDEVERRHQQHRDRDGKPYLEMLQIAENIVEVKQHGPVKQEGKYQCQQENKGYNSDFYHRNTTS